MHPLLEQLQARGWSTRYFCEVDTTITPWAQQHSVVLISPAESTQIRGAGPTLEAALHSAIDNAATCATVFYRLAEKARAAQLES